MQIVADDTDAGAGHVSVQKEIAVKKTASAMDFLTGRVKLYALVKNSS